MYFYAQQVDIDKTTKRHDVILDVATMDAHVELASKLRDQSELNGSTMNNQASMLRFSYVPSGHLGLKEGSWYDINPEVFGDAQYQPVSPDAEGASFLRASLVDLPNGMDFKQFLKKPRFADIPSQTTELVVNPSPGGEIELTVVDCGHGNWNEIKTDTDRLIYDVGASRRFTKSEVQELIAGRDITNETRPISVVISHWDVDHYHALLEFTPSELAKLRAVFTPSQIPDTVTYRRVFERLTTHGVVLEALQPANRLGESREIVLEPHWQKGIYTVLRATPGRSRNQTGIVLGVQGQHEVALLTGDHHYEKLLAAAHKIYTPGQKPCVLVTPHHGGSAGSPSAADWLEMFSSLTTPISCGANSYGHPMSKIHIELKAMQGGAEPWRTDVKQTWTKML